MDMCNLARNVGVKMMSHESKEMGAGYLCTSSTEKFIRKGGGTMAGALKILMFLKKKGVI